MQTFDSNKEEYNKVDLKEFFEDIRKNAMDGGYDLIVEHGLVGLGKDYGSKDPVNIAKNLMAYFIKYEEYEKCAILKKQIKEYTDGTL